MLQTHRFPAHTGGLNARERKGMLEKVTCLGESEHSSLSWFSVRHTWVLTPSRPWACLNGMGWDADQQRELWSRAAHSQVAGQPLLAQ